MIDAEYLDVLLEIWARAQLADRGAYRGLWYPTATPVHKYAQRGGAPLSTAPAYDSSPDAFERVDRAMGKLKMQSPNPLMYDAIHQRLLGEGPDERRARQLRISPDRFKIALGSARRWLRRELDHA
jgi:hypothetical protein